MASESASLLPEWAERYESASSPEDKLTAFLEELDENVPLQGMVRSESVMDILDVLIQRKFTLPDIKNILADPVLCSNFIGGRGVWVVVKR